MKRKNPRLLAALAATSALGISLLTSVADADVPALAKSAQRAPVITVDTSMTRTQAMPAGFEGWSAPALAVTYPTATTARLVRSIDIRPKDNGDYRNLLQWSDIGPDGQPGQWNVVKAGANGTLASAHNLIQAGNKVYEIDFKFNPLTPTNTYSSFVGTRRVSSDGGKSFTAGKSSAIFSPPAIASNGKGRLFAWQGILALNAKEWVMPAYQQGSVWLMMSNDQGRTWRANGQEPVFRLGKRPQLYSESTVEQLPDGRLVLVSRSETNAAWNDKEKKPVDLARYMKVGVLNFAKTSTPVRSLAQLKATTWRKPVVKIAGAESPVGGRPYGVAPRLARAGSYLVLGFGRPGHRISVSKDGVNWSPVGEGYYSNRPTPGTECRELKNHEPCNAIGAQGYMGVASVDADRDGSGPYARGFVAFSNCGQWSCGNTKYVPAPLGITVPSYEKNIRITPFVMGAR